MAHGKPEFTFNCHCSLCLFLSLYSESKRPSGLLDDSLENKILTLRLNCPTGRRSGGAAFVAAAAFKPESIKWSGEMVDYKPANSKVPRRFCASCRTYVAEDARPVLGVFALPLGLTDPQPDKIYWPTQHIFYDSRVIDVSDKLPKFMQMPGGPQFHE